MRVGIQESEYENFGKFDGIFGGLNISGQMCLGFINVFIACLFLSGFSSESMRSRIWCSRDLGKKFRVNFKIYF